MTNHAVLKANRDGDVPGRSEATAMSKQIRRVTVLGTGVPGSQIAFQTAVRDSTPSPTTLTTKRSIKHANGSTNWSPPTRGKSTVPPTEPPHGIA